MTKHADERPEVSKEELRVLDGQHRREKVVELLAIAKIDRAVGGLEQAERTLEMYDATVFVGLRTVVYDAAIERVEDGETTIELPKLPELLASAAVSRCLLPVKLRGHEIKAMRRIMKLTLTDLAKRLDEKTAPETVSRWETEAQPMGGYAEKLLRLLVCEGVREHAPGIEYNASMIADLKVRDPWRADPSYEIPPVELWLLPLKESTGTIIEAWNEKKAA